MIRGHRALRRHLRLFVESLGMPWKDDMLRHDVDEGGQIIPNDQRSEISFRSRAGHFIEMAIFAPSEDREHRPDGKNVLPLGKVAARIDGRVISGPIDQKTWAVIRTAINE